MVRSSTCTSSLTCGTRGQLEYAVRSRTSPSAGSPRRRCGKARTELAHVSRVTSLGALTASIAHEVNQPLSGIITNASTCLRMLAADPPNLDGARETARRTIRDGNRAADVITRLRAMFGNGELALEPVDLNEAAREVIALSSNDLRRNRVVLQHGTGRRAAERQRRSNPAAAGHHEPVAECGGRDERRSRSAAADADQDRARRGHSRARDRAAMPASGLRRARPIAVRRVSHARRATAWVSGSLSAVPSSRNIRGACGPNGTRDREPLSRFPFRSGRIAGDASTNSPIDGSSMACQPYPKWIGDFMNGKSPSISVVDDDESIRESLPDLLNSSVLAPGRSPRRRPFSPQRRSAHQVPDSRCRHARHVGARASRGAEAPALARSRSCSSPHKRTRRMRSEVMARVRSPACSSRSAIRPCTTRSTPRFGRGDRLRRGACHRPSARHILSGPAFHCCIGRGRSYAGTPHRSCLSSMTTSRCASRWSC